MMSIMFMLLAVVARGAEVNLFPPQVPAKLRGVVRTYLRGEVTYDELNFVESAKMDDLSVVMTILDEIDTYLGQDIPPRPTRRVTTLIDRVMGLPIKTKLVESERAQLRQILRPFLERSRRSHVFLPVVDLYRRLDLFDDQDLEFVIERIPNAPLLDCFKTIVRLSHAVGPEDLGRITRAVLENAGNPLVRFSLLDEIGTLPARAYAPTLLGVRNALLPAPGHRPNARDRIERPVFLRLVERWQARFAEGDPNVTDALTHLEAHSSTDYELRFVSLFRAGRLEPRGGESWLNHWDPMGLVPSVSSGNVVHLATCDRWLAARRRAK